MDIALTRDEASRHVILRLKEDSLNEHAILAIRLCFFSPSLSSRQELILDSLLGGKGKKQLQQTN